MAKKKSSRFDSAAAALGRRDARELLKRRAAVLRKRAKALGAGKGDGGCEPRAVSAGTLVAEGDSWFDYPFHDVLKSLEDTYGFDVNSVAHKGDAVEEMAYAGGQLDDFIRALEKTLKQGVVPRAILLSGGGNDVAGDEFHMLLNHAKSNIAGINDAVVDGIINQRIRAAYVHIISAITAICQDQAGQKIRIVVHGYDFPVPDGRGYLGGFWFLPGPWLQPGFQKKGFSDLRTCTDIMQDLMGRFNQMIATVSQMPGFEHVRFADLRGTLDNSPSRYKRWWENELHPTSEGFDAVAVKFVRAINGP